MTRLQAARTLPWSDSGADSRKPRGGVRLSDEVIGDRHREVTATLKNEMYYRQAFATRVRARFAVAEYIEVFYNRRRLHSTLGYRTPFEALTDYRAAATAAA
jgi:transposase InsO family protein